jgi:hypothetical protein
MGRVAKDFYRIHISSVLNATCHPAAVKSAVPTPDLLVAVKRHISTPISTLMSGAAAITLQEDEPYGEVELPYQKTTAHETTAAAPLVGGAAAMGGQHGMGMGGHHGMEGRGVRVQEGVVPVGMVMRPEGERRFESTGMTTGTTSAHGMGERREGRLVGTGVGVGGVMGATGMGREGEVVREEEEEQQPGMFAQATAAAGAAMEKIKVRWRLYIQARVC